MNTLSVGLSQTIKGPSLWPGASRFQVPFGRCPKYIRVTFTSSNEHKKQVDHDALAPPAAAVVRQAGCNAIKGFSHQFPKLAIHPVHYSPRRQEES
jgi:hypothetical protein